MGWKTYLGNIIEESIVLIFVKNEIENQEVGESNCKFFKIC